MTIDIAGWDIGGAHLKLATMNAAGDVLETLQRPCPLWQGVDRLTAAVGEVAGQIPLGEARLHALTMTGELADAFPNRREGVETIVATMRRCLDAPLLIFAGPRGLIDPTEVRDQDLDRIASANWLAGGMLAARRCQSGVLIDVGSTTTDLVAFGNGEVHARGYTDWERLRYDELLYLGILRTPVMAIADRGPFEGRWVPLMNEHFATAADIYRLTGECPEPADHYPAADGGAKDRVGSARRLARMVGRDVDSAPLDAWIGLAAFFRECQISRITDSLALQRSRGIVRPDSPLIGAGIGRFLVRVLARRSGREYIDAGDLLPRARTSLSFSVADCLPAAAVAYLAGGRS